MFIDHVQKDFVVKLCVSQLLWAYTAAMWKHAAFVPEHRQELPATVMWLQLLASSAVFVIIYPTMHTADVKCWH
jgi:hypothetical protein